MIQIVSTPDEEARIRALPEFIPVERYAALQPLPNEIGSMARGRTVQEFEPGVVVRSGGEPSLRFVRAA